MIKKYTHATQLLTCLFIIGLLLGCSKSNQTDQISCDVNCLSMQNEQMKVLFDTDLILVEQQYQITITSTQPINAMYINGTNMNMGTLPLIFTRIKTDSTDFIYQSSFMLGLCSEPEMEWQLNLKTKETTNSFNFISYWQRPKDR